MDQLLRVLVVSGFREAGGDGNDETRGEPRVWESVVVTGLECGVGAVSSCRGVRTGPERLVW